MSAKRAAGQPEGAEETRAQREEREAQEQVERDLDELAETRKERDEYLELAQRTRADFENYRKRAAGEASEAIARGKAELARELIPALDNLERALLSAGVDLEAATAQSDGAADAPSQEVSARDALAHGVALVYRELRGSLQRAGVEAYDPVGEPFDPNLHEALTTRAEEDAKPGTVVETVERGYRLDGQVLRAARVVVSE